ncbi:4-(cytidine 5'-diphospho)-2-C-methyl-D-erythritol kinase [Paracoccaceae bacterium]|nr:4-(cytidine 5'-diphospho)-2-C-methyl-D-erythritol kinase [Paracoccaceae bacterium]
MKEITIEEKGCAKINLALHVTGEKDDGYHILDSIVIFADIFDNLSFKKDRKNVLTFTGEFAKSLNVEKNSVTQALNLFGNLLTEHFSINIEKNLPLGAGLGGGSADAAAIIRFMTNYCRHPMPSPEAISKIGADVPVCVLSLASRVGGIGEITRPIDISGIDLWIVLVNPRIFVATGSIFEEVTEKHNEPLEPFASFRKTDQFIDYLKRQRNDLQSIAVNKWPEIKEVLNAIEKTQDVLLSRMSGSGSTCFGLYRTQDIAKRAVSYLNKKSNKWWVKYSKVN